MRWIVGRKVVKKRVRGLDMEWCRVWFYRVVGLGKRLFVFLGVKE